MLMATLVYVNLICYTSLCHILEDDFTVFPDFFFPGMGVLKCLWCDEHLTFLCRLIVNKNG